jgi:hypothetical protein
MADIEERAEKWAREHAEEQDSDQLRWLEPHLVAAYLAGSAQTQADYSADCSRCVCTCGAR